VLVHRAPSRGIRRKIPPRRPPEGRRLHHRAHQVRLLTLLVNTYAADRLYLLGGLQWLSLQIFKLTGPGMGYQFAAGRLCRFPA
jgi:hypothetical protein